MRLKSAALAVLVLFGLAFAVACSDDEGSARVVVGDETLTATPTASAPADSTAEATESVPTAAPTQATQAPTTAVPTPSTTPTVETGSRSDLDGFPYSTSDVRAAVRAQRLVFFPVDHLEPLCPDTAIAELPVWTAHDGGTDFGPVFVLWVYPDEETLALDWSTGPDGVEPKTSCNLPTGYVYWNANTILAFRTWFSVGEDVGPYDAERDPREQGAVDAFLAMTP